MRKLRTFFTTLIVLFILLISCHEPEIEIKREKLQPIAYTSLVQEKALGLAMELAGFSNKSVSGGRLMAGLANYKPDSILKVLQSDSTHYTYTLQLEGGANLNSFRNLVFRRVANGYYGSVVEYSFKNGVFNPEKFTGTINRYDLEGKLFFKATLENGNVTASNSGKINYQCIEFAWEAHDGTPCVPLGSGGPGGDGCSLVMIVSPCGHGSSGGPYTPTPDGGSYVPDPYGAGGGTGGSSSGGSKGGPSAPDPSNPTYEGEEPIGVLPGKNNAEYLRAKQLKELLIQNPVALLEIPCAQLPKWQTLAQNRVPKAIKDKINQLEANTGWFDDWAVQTLNGASGTIANMDYFSVAVSTLPKNPATGRPFTAEGFLDYFRRNINDFAEGSTFSPYCETPTLCTQETALWNSTNPTGAIIYIDIPVDDGVVICSEYTPSYWYFMTLEAPGAGNHPVSGTRQFGFEPNETGGYNFFVRGVDRFDSNLIENASYMVSGGHPFKFADALWISFQNRLNSFINSNGGSSTVSAPITYRPDWDKVKQVLDGTKQISDLGCK